MTQFEIVSNMMSPLSVVSMSRTFATIECKSSAATLHSCMSLRRHFAALICCTGYRFSIGSSGSGPSEFSGPTSVAVDSHGRLLVADFNNSRIQGLVYELLMMCDRLTATRTVFNCADGSFVGQWGHGLASNEFLFQTPSAIAVDRSTGNVLVADYTNHLIYVF